MISFRLTCKQMCKTFFLFFPPKRLSQASNVFSQTSDLRLLIVLHWHGDDVEAYYDGDEQVQVVAGAHLVDEKAGGGVIRVVGLTLSFCWKWEMVGGVGVKAGVSRRRGRRRRRRRRWCSESETGGFILGQHTVELLCWGLESTKPCFKGKLSVEHQCIKVTHNGWLPLRIWEYGKRWKKRRPIR